MPAYRGTERETLDTLLFWLVLCSFANLRGCPETENMSLLPCKGYEHQNDQTTRTGLRAILHDVYRAEEEKRSHNGFTKKREKNEEKEKKRKKIKKEN
jgi:hypothetical protein